MQNLPQIMNPNFLWDGLPYILVKGSLFLSCLSIVQVRRKKYAIKLGETSMLFSFFIAFFIIGQSNTEDFIFYIAFFKIGRSNTEVFFFCRHTYDLFNHDLLWIIAANIQVEEEDRNVNATREGLQRGLVPVHDTNSSERDAAVLSTLLTESTWSRRGDVISIVRALDLYARESWWGIIMLQYRVLAQSLESTDTCLMFCWHAISFNEGLFGLWTKAIKVEDAAVTIYVHT